MRNDIFEKLGSNLSAKKKNEIATEGIDLLDDTTDNSKFRKQCAVEFQTILQQSLGGDLPAQRQEVPMANTKQDGWKATN